jgi:hypothetical protein
MSDKRCYGLNLYRLETGKLNWPNPIHGEKITVKATHCGIPLLESKFCTIVGVFSQCLIDGDGVSIIPDGLVDGHLHAVIAAPVLTEHELNAGNTFVTVVREDGTVIKCPEPVIQKVQA